MPFQWTLQKLLDVTDTRELAAKAELFDISRRIARLQEDILRRKSMVNALLQDMRQMTIQERMSRQEPLMRGMAMERENIRLMISQTNELDELREEKKVELAKITAKKDTLNRLHDEARKKYQHLLGLKEQQRADESFNVRFVRNRQLSLKSEVA